MTPDQIIREEFEMWYSDQGAWPITVTRSATNQDGYKFSETQVAWGIWKAAWAIAQGYVA